MSLAYSSYSSSTVWAHPFKLTERCISSERAVKELECHLLSIGSNLPSVIQGGFPKDPSGIIKSGVPWSTIRSVTLRDTSFAGSFWVFASTEWILAVYWVCLVSCGDTDLQRLTSPCGHGQTHTAHTATAVHSIRWAMSGVCSDLQWSGSSFVGRSTSAQHISAPCSQILFGWAFPWPLLWWQPMCCTSVFKYIYYELLWLPRGLDT